MTIQYPTVEAASPLSVSICACSLRPVLPCSLSFIQEGRDLRSSGISSTRSVIIFDSFRRFTCDIFLVGLHHESALELRSSMPCSQLHCSGAGISSFSLLHGQLSSLSSTNKDINCLCSQPSLLCEPSVLLLPPICL